MNRLAGLIVERAIIVDVDKMVGRSDTGQHPDQDQLSVPAVFVDRLARRLADRDLGALGDVAEGSGEIQAKLWPRDDSERAYAADEGLDLTQVLTTRDLVDSDNTFFAATGVTTGELLDGVRFGSHTVRTNSLVLRSKTGTVRFMEAIHRVEQLRDIAAFEL